MTREEKEAIKGKVINDAMNSIENRVRHVYNQGFEEGKNYYIQKHDDAYNKGLEDAWECARKIVVDSGYDAKTLKQIFGTQVIPDVFKHSASEVVVKIKEYEEQQRQKCEDDFENKQLEQLCNHLEQQKHTEQSCDAAVKNCDNCGYALDDDCCEILANKGVCEDHSEWIPENTAKSCKTCGYSYGQHKEYCNIFGCFDCEKWTQAQICHTCQYDGDNYDKFNIDPYEKKLHCAWCDNFNEYKSIYNDVNDGNNDIDDKIKVGDQLEIIESSAEHRKCVVLKIDDCATVVYDDGDVGYINPECYRKTGKHFPELIEFTKKMKEK